jgi:pimeloyl-ACP methyl ester carboxylesterase
LASSLAGCATPLDHVERIAAASGYERRVVAGQPFEHLVYIKRGEGNRGDLHVYIEGDGTPWFSRHRVAIDPTPRQPLMLELMRMDPGPAVYLGRPCYFDLKKHCRPAHWTSERYSSTVVASMTAALAAVRRQQGWHGEVTLLGHSGGGALAMLMASRVPDTTAVLTIAGNLDIEAWTRLHGYTPLTGSLNPADTGPLPARIRQLHLVGGRDETVPPRITRSGLRTQDDAEIRRFPEQGHQCCWKKIWPSLLRLL